MKHSQKEIEAIIVAQEAHRIKLIAQNKEVANKLLLKILAATHSNTVNAVSSIKKYRA